MQKNLFQKIKQAVSGRLLVLKKKVNNGCFKKFTLTFHSRLQAGKQRLAAVFGWVKQNLGWEACVSYVQLAAAWCRFWLGKEARQVYVWAANEWVRKHLNKDDLKGYGKAALCWLKALPKQMTKENFKKWAHAGWLWLRALPDKFRTQRKYALLASCVLLALWLYLGSATTLAWYTDVTPVERNSFVVGELKLNVEYRNDKVTTYTDMTEDSAVFNDEALYEPGYTQVVYLKIENKGTVDFDYKVTVKDFSCVDSTNVYGQNLHLPEYLRFGIVTAPTEPQLERKVAQQLANKDMIDYYLGEYSQPDAPVTVYKDGEPHYAALIVWMPEEVGNEANYRGDIVPQVTLGVTVYAQQAGTPME